MTLRAGLIAIALFAHLCAAHAAADCARADALVRQAAILDGQPRIEAYRAAVDACGHAFNARYGLGMAYLRNGDARQALDSLKAAERTARQPGEQGAAKARQSQALMLLGERAEALAAIDGAYQLLGAAAPGWMQQLRRDIHANIMDSPVTADDIGRVFRSQRAFGVAPRIDLNVLFDYDSDRLTAQGQAQVDELGKALAGMGAEDRFEIVGHTDKRGDAAYNLKLSERRAQRVRETLATAHSALLPRLSAVGKGKGELRYPGDSEEDHRLNRRVEVKTVMP